MSYQQLKNDTLFYQRFLKSNGFYQGILDGDWGPKTDAADTAFRQRSQQIAAQEGSVDPRSESNIITLAPKAQISARKFLKILKAAGKDVRIISGTRTYAEQDAIYAQGRNGNAGKIVTQAKGGQSNHNFGIAWDIGIFHEGTYSTDDAEYVQIAPLVMPSLPELEWGGNWIHSKDHPHYQHKSVSADLDVVRNDFEAGMVYV
jgi:peptidoglycan L-alanyl-D-glutamate endopeptidase CwlK